jgi:hypothetical protein
LESTRFSKERLLHILINRTALFFFVMCVLTLFLYVAGTVQEFTDATQFALLTLYSVLGIFLTITSISGIILDMTRFIGAKKGRYFFRAGGYLFLVVFGGVTVIAVMAILALSGGEGIKR